ncbi:hypothetical protein MMMDOFMJ_2490 [Methylobacterium gnaphalii]|nr:hypothetical protein MMMDOFMJ_2490 [Methylobacterium gnaphalii]
MLRPMALEEIERIPVEARTGPIIVSERTSLLYTQRQFERMWKRVRTEGSCPPNSGATDFTQRRH